MSRISVFNTKSKQKEEFTPISQGKASIYHCGPTVYHYQHIGNMRRFIFADLVHRMLSTDNYEVKQVINITDVGHLVSDNDEGEDKMEKGSKREGKSAQEIAKLYTDDFMSDLKLLKISTDDTIFPKATENIPEQIAMIQDLEKKGLIYIINDGVYFDTSKFPAYADFAHLDLKGIKEGARVEVNIEKKNPTDFALWKFSSKDEKRQQEWLSPWGIGFPGWHIECSAMAKKFLGNTIDIHTGGVDHISVHHTNEIAQSDNANGVPLANYWMHNEHVDFGNEKISKSGDSFIRLKDLIERGYHPLAYRYFTMLAHYRTKINFTFEGLDSATVAWKRLNDFFVKTENGGRPNDLIIEKVRTALFDDINTPKIISTIWEMMKREDISDQDKKATLKSIDNLIGIIDFDYKTKETMDIKDVPTEVQKVIEERQTARKNKEWQKADELRKQIYDKGYELIDNKDSFIIKEIQ